MYLQTILSNPDLCRMQQRLSLDIRISGDFFSSISGAALNRPPKKKEKRKRKRLHENTIYLDAYVFGALPLNSVPQVRAPALISALCFLLSLTDLEPRATFITRTASRGHW